MSTDVYAFPDLTKKVRQRDGDRGERRDSEDSGQSEEDRGQMEEMVVDIYEEDRGQMEEMVVDIYQSVDFIRSSDVVSGAQGDLRDEDTGGVMKDMLINCRLLSKCISADY